MPAMAYQVGVRLPVLGRRLWAARAGGLFITAQCLLPLVHSLDHRPDHSHGSGPIPWRVLFQLPDHDALHRDAIEHRHEVVTAEAADGDERPGPGHAPEHPGERQQRREHGTGSILHFGAAVQAGPPASGPAAPTPLDFREEAKHELLPDLAPARTRNPRGPPRIEHA
jgi:hypothetical protein